MASMLSFRLVGLLIASVLTTVAADAVAEPLRCPQRLAFIANDPALVRQAETMKAVYGRIGCPDVAFIGLPGRRGVVAFNMGEVQGEMMRLPEIEVEYTRPFTRVMQPVVQMTGRLWARDAALANDGPLGFVLGVVWQEQYAQDVARGRGGIGYHSQADLFRAYVTGVIDRFLAEDPAVNNAVRDGRLPLRPAHAGTQLVSASLYHYVGAEFADAAAAVATELSRREE